MFRFSIENSPGEEKWVVQGRLAGAFADDLGANWDISVNRAPSCLRVVDIRDVVFIDRIGEEVLRRMICQHAKILASGIYTEFLLEKLQASGGADRAEE